MSNSQLSQAIEMIKAGKTSEGAALLQLYLRTEPRSEVGWLWMTACVETNAQKCDCLHRALEINPQNTRAREALQKLGMVVDEPSMDRILAAPTAAPAAAPAAAAPAPAMPISKPLSDFIPAVCPNCGGKLEVKPGAESLVCQYCGTEHIVRHNMNGALTLEAYARCPVCQRNDRAEKVSAILHNQVARTNGMVTHQRIVTGPGGRAYTQNVNVPVQTTQVSDLAARLVAPAAPANVVKPKKAINKYSISTWLLIGGFTFSIITISALFSAFSNSSPTSSTAICAVIPLALLSIACLVGWYFRRGKDKQKFKQIESQANYEFINWQKAMARWERLYYCGRDDVIFIPGEKTSARVTEMMAYLYSFAKT